MTSSIVQNTSTQNKNLIVRVAKLEIDPTRIENYETALKEHAEATVYME